MESSTFFTPDWASAAVPQIPGEAQPAFQRAALYDAEAAGETVVETGGVLSTVSVVKITSTQ